MAALNDPHIIQIHFIGRDGEQPYFAMEFVDAESVSSLLERESRLKTAHGLKICPQAAQGLATTQSLGVIHHDIMPSKYNPEQARSTEDQEFRNSFYSTRILKKN